MARIFESLTNSIGRYCTLGDVSTAIWGWTLLALILLLGADFATAFRNRHKPTSIKTATIWIIFYILAAVLFGFLLPSYLHPSHQGEFFSGWLTEYSLSFDNLFVFYLILKKLKVEPHREEMVLFLGILGSIFLRMIFIFTGSAIINRFESIFFLFSAFLFYTAFTLLRENKSDEWEEGRVVNFLRARGSSTFFIAFISLSLINLIFAFDSIPAIFGITRNTYIIVTANVFAIMGLRQLYFLIGGFLNRIYYINEGLSFLLAFIAFKLLMSACIDQGWRKVLGIKLPEVSTGFTLAVILLTLGTTALLSLFKKNKV
jgi:tellurite resistance protein TerC